MRSVPIRGRADIGRIRDAITYFANGGGQGREARRLGETSEMASDVALVVFVWESIGSTGMVKVGEGGSRCALLDGR